jgi:predicted glycogen debranching enzyme
MVVERFSHYEWVLSNRKGGYALGPADLLNHRKYHGLLVASGSELRRMHLVSSIEERLETEDISFFLDSNSYPNVVYPQGYRHIFRYFLRPFPVFLFSTTPFSYEILLLKSIQMHEDLNFSVIRYKNRGEMPLVLRLRPKFTLRSHHVVHQPGFWDAKDHFFDSSGNTGIVFCDGQQAFVYCSKGKIENDPVIYRNIVYPSEIVRGYEGVEDLLAPFTISAEVEPEEELFLVFGDTGEIDFEKVAREASQRYNRWPLPVNHPGALSDTPEKVFLALTAHGEKAFDYRSYMETLRLAFDEFICDHDLIAGIPWFSAWGRDTMISLEALKYLENGVSLAYEILHEYGRNLKDGLVPNTLGEGGVGRNYETVDASLWFGMRIVDFWEQFRESERSVLLESLFQVIGNYLFNESLPFYIDPRDGLIDIQPSESTALTWMDAKVYGKSVTPRCGKPIEVNALWYSLLESFSAIAGERGIDHFSCGDSEVTTAKIRELSAKVGRSLRKFVHETGFADRIEDDRLIKETRPNYIIALSLPHDVFTKEEMKTGYEIAKERLLTRYGVRSLAPDSRAYRRKYMGNQTMRDLAYHQGTVWVWLLLPMAKVAVKIYGRDAHLKRELQGLVSVFRDGFMSGNMASVPEIYDGNEPYYPKGAPAQCWSVAAILAIEEMLEKVRGAL